MQGLYQDILLDHYKHPRNSGVLTSAHFSSDQYNPSCGDSVQVCGTFDENAILTDVQFKATGCVISVATASLLSEKIKGMALLDILSLDTPYLFTLIGMSLGPTRLKCALLPLIALHDGLKKWQKCRSS